MIDNDTIGEGARTSRRVVVGVAGLGSGRREQ